MCGVAEKGNANAIKIPQTRAIMRDTGTKSRSPLFHTTHSYPRSLRVSAHVPALGWEPLSLEAVSQSVTVVAAS